MANTYIKDENIFTMNSTYNSFPGKFSIVCFSHLRWGFVFQRPQHLLSRFARCTTVYFFEEPVFHHGENNLQVTQPSRNINVITPHLKHGMAQDELNITHMRLIAHFLLLNNIKHYCAWYYTPMALDFTFGLQPDIVVYDCMDELSAFKFAPPVLKEREQQLLNKADIVFTGGNSIYKAKRHKHPNIHSFPSSIDKEHFGKARTIKEEPADQQAIAYPRFGFFGVLDERFDIDLVKQVAEQRPQWQFVLIGPVVKIDPATLPRYANVHYLGGKSYDQLPHYLAGWDIAVIPFAINESTKYISPTKTPEYLAGGKPVISTPITDVVNPYGDNKLVYIVNNADEFIKAAETEFSKTGKKQWLKKVDEFLKDNSWDNTWQRMVELLQNVVDEKSPSAELGSYLPIPQAG